MAYRERTDPKSIATERFLAATERETRALAAQARCRASVSRGEVDLERARSEVGRCVAALRHLEAVATTRALMPEAELGERMAAIEEHLRQALQLSFSDDLEAEQGRLAAARNQAEEGILRAEEALAIARAGLADALRELNLARRERDAARAELARLSTP